MDKSCMFFISLYLLLKEYDQIYTDGSLKDDKDGFAIVTNKQIIKKNLIFQSSIYSAEQQAIIAPMESTTRPNNPKFIATDSLSSLLAASGNRCTRNPKTRNIRRLLDNSRNHIKLIWVPSRVGIGRNKAADQAAKDGLNEEIGNQGPYPPQDLIKWMKKKGVQ
jgi:ribonuclease HI